MSCKKLERKMILTLGMACLAMLVWACGDYKVPEDNDIINTGFIATGTEVHESAEITAPDCTTLAGASVEGDEASIKMTWTITMDPNLTSAPPYVVLEEPCEWYEVYDGVYSSLTEYDDCGTVFLYPSVGGSASWSETYYIWNLGVAMDYVGLGGTFPATFWFYKMYTAKSIAGDEQEVSAGGSLFVSCKKK